MRKKIAIFLEQGPRRAQDILREALSVQAPNPTTAEVILKSMVGSDPRFRRRSGLWSVIKSTPARPFRTAALSLEWSDRDPRWCRGAIHYPEDGSCLEFLRAEGAGTETLSQARAQLTDHLLLAWSDQELRQWNRFLRLSRLPEWQGESLAISRLAARALPGKHLLRGEDLPAVLDLPTPDSGSPVSMARFVSTAYDTLRARIPSVYSSSAGGIMRWIEEGVPKVDFSRFGFGRDLLARIPEDPGVYLMRDRAGCVIYVGKSGNLRRRVRSYFTPRALTDPKVIRIHNQLHSLEFLTCATEIEALLMEIRMIRDFRPAINLQAQVHERPDRYGRGKNLLILVPVDQNVQIYFVRDGVFCGCRQSALCTAPGNLLLRKIRSVFFSVGKRRRIQKWESDIVASWFAANRRRMNYIDVDDCGAYETVVRRLESYLADADRLAQKIYYR